MDKKYYSIAIDGPSGAGKSTLAKAIAKKYGIIYVDTGAIYRTVGYYLACKGIGSKDTESIRYVLPDINIDIKYNVSGEQRMILNGDDVSDYIRTPQISIYASDVSSLPFVRQFLLMMQRDMALKNNVIMDGRDIGTVVLPDADVKIFLVASAEKRAVRRVAQLAEKGIVSTYEDVLKDIIYRDKQDSEREAAPLKQADDAVLVDNSDCDFETCLNRISMIIENSIDLRAV